MASLPALRVACTIPDNEDGPALACYPVLAADDDGGSSPGAADGAAPQSETSSLHFRLQAPSHEASVRATRAPVRHPPPALVLHPTNKVRRNSPSPLPPPPPSPTAHSGSLSTSPATSPSPLASLVLQLQFPGMYRPNRARSSSPRPPSQLLSPPNSAAMASDFPSSGSTPSSSQRHTPPPDQPPSLVQRRSNYNAPVSPSPAATMPDRPRRDREPPKRSTTLGSPGELDRERDYFDRGERERERERGSNAVTRLHTLPASSGPRSRSVTPQGPSFDVQQPHSPSPDSAARPQRSDSPATFISALSSPLQTPNDHPHAHIRTPSPALTRRSSASASSHSPTARVATIAQQVQPQPRPSSAGSDSANTTITQSTLSQPICCACGAPMTGQFVRALGNVYHLDCFRCRDCDRVVAQKFFPIEGPDGRQQPLCERDYFRRLNLICGKCGQALRGSYITACNKKFHVEHFSCCVCPTLFGPSDSYYEHGGDVYCHFHYSTRFATKCVGCGSAILKQFVEINRNLRDECWHPECYMIHKFWNVKMTSKLPPSAVPPLPPDSTPEGTPPELQPTYEQEEASETADSLRTKQRQMEQQVYRIWTVLSAFEESSATCISDMLKHVANGHWLNAIRNAEKFILHVEVLFAVVDDLEAQFVKVNAKGMSHVREARMLCRKTVDLFTLLSRTEATVDRRMRFTEELLALVTGLAHYLKILIRIALTGSLKLEREHADRDTGAGMLDKLHALTHDGADPASRRATTRAIRGGNTPGTQGVVYGYKCLAPEYAGESPFSPGGSADAAQMEPPSDLCVECKVTVEEDCVRLGTYLRWHSNCVKCERCARTALPPTKDSKDRALPAAGDETPAPPRISSSRRPPALVQEFVYWPGQRRPGTLGEPVPAAIFCVTDGGQECKPGFEAVSKLEQFAFLLNVALRRLYILLQRRGWMALPGSLAPSESSSEDGRSMVENYRDSTEIMRLKSVHLDRKLSATARLPKRSTIVESPSGKIAQPTDATVHSHQQYVRGPTTHAPVEMAPAVQAQHPQQYRPPPSRPAPPPPSQSPATLAQPTARPLSVSPGPLTPGVDGIAVLRPSFARNNTSVRIIDASLPGAMDLPPPDGEPSSSFSVDEDGITLADIPQMMEAEQAREQHRSLPRQAGKPLIAELTPLELLVVKHFAVFALHRSPLKEQFDLDEILELVEVKNRSLWNKLFKGEKKNVKKKGAFGVPLEILVEREGVDSLLGASRTPLRVPSFIDDLISAMKQMDMSVEGVFRKNGNIRRLKDLVDAIDRDPASIDLSAENPVQLAALLKKFLGDLPDPLLTFKLHRLFCATQKFSNADDRRKYLHLVSMLLPKCHRDTMEVLFVFLKWVASFSHVDEETGSKMDLQNLATVICPSILYAKGRDPAKDEIFLAIRVVSHLLEQQDDFYTVPDDFIPVLNDIDYFANCAELPRKEILKKCETYWKLKHPKPGSNGGLPSSNSFNNGLPVPRPDGAPRADSEVRLVTRRSDPALSNRPSPPTPAPYANGARSTQGQQSHPNYSQEILSQSLGSWEDVSMHVGSPPKTNGHYMHPSRPAHDAPRSGHPRQPDPRWNSPPPDRPPPGSRPTSYVRTDHHGFPPNGRQSPAIHSRA